MEVEVNEPISVASSLGTSDGGLGEENPHNFDPDSHLAGSGVRPSYYGGYIPHSTLLPRRKLSHDATIPTIIEQQQQIIEQPHLSVEVPSTYLQPVNIPSPTDNNTSSSPPSFMKRVSSLNSISNLQPVNIPSPPKNNTASPQSFMKRISSVNSISHFLDQSGHLLKGKGILASKRDVDVAPEEFAEGCKLLQAAALDSVQRIEDLLKHSSPLSIEFRDYDRRTALHVAASEGSFNVVRHIVERYHARINRVDRWGGTPLDDANRHRHTEVAQYLRLRGGTTGAGDMTGVLLAAAAEGDLNEVAALLGGSKDPKKDSNKCDYDKRTALHLASAGGHVTVVEFLLTVGADPNPEDQWGGRPLDDAERNDWTECSNALKIKGGKRGDEAHQNHLKTSSTKDDIERDEKELAVSENPNIRADFSELEMIDKIGAGAFGEIYKCRWRGTVVAAKCIKSRRIYKKWHNGTTGASQSESELAIEDIQEALEDFRRETLILSHLRHPNICMLLAYSHSESFEVMISELMKCSLLDVFNADRLNNKRISRTQQIRYSQQLAQGMHYLHTCKPPVIHRDLKPANLLIDFSGVLKITDFGLAKVRPDPKSLESDHFLMTGETGSYRFMAPEVFRHEEYDERVDVYSFAMIFYYLLSGLPPFGYSTSGLKAAMRAAVQAERPVEDRSWDLQLTGLLKMCWDENRARRPDFGTVLRILAEYSRTVLKIDAEPLAEIGYKKCCTIS